MLLALVITCCVCMCVKNKGRPGRIVAPTTGGPMVISKSLTLTGNNSLNFHILINGMEPFKVFEVLCSIYHILKPFRKHHYIFY